MEKRKRSHAAWRRSRFAARRATRPLADERPVMETVAVRTQGGTVYMSKAEAESEALRFCGMKLADGLRKGVAATARFVRRNPEACFGLGAIIVAAAMNRKG